MPFVRTCRLLSLLALWLPGLALASPAIDAANVQARQFITRVQADQRIPGMQVTVIKDGQVVLSENRGLANVENQVPVTATTLFPINSATKSFTGVAIMQLVAQRKVALDAPISRYLDELPPAWQGIRVRQLLAHTSGLPDIVDGDGLVGGGNEQAAWQAVRALPMAGPAGAGFAYNQTNYGLLAQIIQRVSGMPYERFVAERQFAAAGMRRATFGDSYDLVPGAVTVYSWSPRGTLASDDADRLSHRFHDIPYSLWAGGGLQSSAAELSQWLIALMDGSLLDAAGRRRMWTAETLGNGADGAWGMGWPVLQSAPEQVVAGIGGARAAFIVYPQQALAVVVLTNLAGSNPQRFIGDIAAFYRAPAVPSPR